jgi:hypothetical protein
MNLHPNIIEKEGKKEFVVLPYDEFTYLKDIMETFNDLQELRKAKREEKNATSISLGEIKKDFL